MAMTRAEAKAHADKELQIKADIKSLTDELREGNYRTKVEKEAISEELRLKRIELRLHLGLSLEGYDLTGVEIPGYEIPTAE